MKFGLAPPNYARWFDGAAAREVCTAAERMGFDSLWFGDHVALPREQADIFGNAYLDALALIGFVAAATSTIRLGTNVLVVPYRDPVVTAKVVATLDVLSGGRIDLGVGVGHVAGEFAALGVRFEDRGAMTDEYLRAMRTLWAHDCASFEGRWVRFDDLCPLTRPLQDPLPLLIGGDGPRSMRRALEHDAGWAPGQGTIADLERKVRQLDDLAAEAGRPRPRVVARWLVHPVQPGAVRPPIPHRGELRRPRLDAAEAREQLEQIAALGIDEVIVDIPAKDTTYLENMAFVADELIAPMTAPPREAGR